MIAADLDRVFGRERLRMPSGEHVEVFRESAQPGERLRYSKRFVRSLLGDFRSWTEREWQILQRLTQAGPAPVPQIAGFTPAAGETPAQLQTFDAGVTVDQWTTLRPSHPDRPAARHVFEDCAHWWALAHHCLRVLDAVHGQGLVHLDLKADNICIPWDRARSIQPAADEIRALRFGELKLIDFAFAVFTGEDPPQPLPLGRHTRYDYQSPRLLEALGAGRRGLAAPTRQLDWRCDFFSLAAMLWLYLPELEERGASSWSPERHAQAGVLVRRLLDEHQAELTAQRPHQELIALTQVLLNQADLAASLRQGWTFSARDDGGGGSWATPLTRITGTVRPEADSSERQPKEGGREAAMMTDADLPPSLRKRPPTSGVRVAKVAAGVAGAAVVGAILWTLEAPPSPGSAPSAATQDPVLAEAPATRDGTAAERGAATATTPAPALPPASVAPASSPAAFAEDVARTPPAGSGAAARTDEPRAVAEMTTTAPDAASDAVRAGSAAPVASAPAAASTDATAPAPAPRTESPPPTEPPPRTEPLPRTDTPPRREPDAAAEAAVADESLDAQALVLLGVDIPQIAAWADRRLAPVLRLADRTDMLPRREELRGAVAAARLGPGRPELKLNVRAQESRRLNEAARVAYWERSNVKEAVRLQVQAFAANPLDSEVAGNLAFLRMRQQPPQIRAARQLALHSLALPDPRYPLGRVQDWTTLAISSALVGRETDARHAWYISLVLAPDRQRQRNAALRAVSIYGEKLRPSVEAMLRREFPADRSSGRSGARRPSA
ncbi:MAG TPA: hypothetical protein VHM00_03755 [Caldimonas sp.]|nr:hypothetical protein [Caldimonas sp.]HEX2540180.1 hypothetical protein [Caldimonas sp.]